MKVEVAVTPYNGEGGEEGRLAESVEDAWVRQRIGTREVRQVTEWALVDAVSPAEQVTRRRLVGGRVANGYGPAYAMRRKKVVIRLAVTHRTSFSC